MNIIDLFSGAGGLSEGFRINGINNIAHVEMDRSACKTLQVREAFHYLRENNQLNLYEDFVKGKIKYEELISYIPSAVNEKVINEEINENTLKGIFTKIDKLKQDKTIHGIVGGPPCQAYSTIGRVKNKYRLEYDERIYLFHFYVDFLVKYKPDFFVFENVKGLLSFKDFEGNPLLPLIKEQFQNALYENSYEVNFKVIDSSKYGVPQKRERLIIFGKRKGATHKCFFEELLSYQESPPILREIFADLPKLKNGKSDNSYIELTSHEGVQNYYRQYGLPLSQNISRPNNENDLEIYRLVAINKQKGKNIKYTDLPKRLITHKNITAFLDRFKALDESDISHTVVAHIAKDGHYYIHPDHNQNRSITVREAARIQSFPDDYLFLDSRTSSFRQIGNAVPPLLADKFAKVVKNNLFI